MSGERRLHGNRAIAVVERWRLRSWLMLGGLGVGAPLALTFPAVGALDLLLVGIAMAAAGGTLWVVRLKRFIDGLPLEIAPVVGTGLVDGVRVYRFRARLGRGRLLRDPSAEVSFVGSDGAPRRLDVEVPRGRLLGPFTVLARDRGGACATPGEFQVGVAASAGGTEWRAERRIPVDAVRDGWFGGFDDWTSLGPGG
jgi:hypothetical protein